MGTFQMCWDWGTERCLQFMGRSGIECPSLWESLVKMSNKTIHVKEIWERSTYRGGLPAESRETQYLITRMVTQSRSLQRVAFLMTREGCIKRQGSHSKDGQHLGVEVSLGFRDSKTLCHSQKAQTRPTREGDTSWPQGVAETRQTDMQRHGTTATDSQPLSSSFGGRTEK